MLGLKLSAENMRWCVRDGMCASLCIQTIPLFPIALRRLRGLPPVVSAYLLFRDADY